MIQPKTLQREAESILVLRGATVIDCTGAPAQPEMTVVIKGDCITALGKTDISKQHLKQRIINREKLSIKKYSRFHKNA